MTKGKGVKKNKKRAEGRDPSLPSGTLAVCSIAYDRASGRFTHTVNGWQSLAELESVLDLFLRQVVRPALIQEEVERLAQSKQREKEAEDGSDPTDE